MIIINNYTYSRNAFKDLISYSKLLFMHEYKLITNIIDSLLLSKAEIENVELVLRNDDTLYCIVYTVQ